MNDPERFFLASKDPSYLRRLDEQLERMNASLDAAPRKKPTNMTTIPQTLTAEDRAFCARHSIPLATLADARRLSDHEIAFCKAHDKDPAEYARVKAKRIARRQRRVI